MYEENEEQKLYNGKEKSTVYVKKEEEYKDLFSSAITFLVVSVIGIVVLLLNSLGIIKIFYGLLPLIVMGGMMIAFLLVGVFSLRKALIVKSQISEENETTKLILNWLSDNITYELLEEKSRMADSFEEKFYHHIEFMKDMVNTQFGELNDSYLERLLEEFYNTHFDM